MTSNLIQNSLVDDNTQLGIGPMGDLTSRFGSLTVVKSLDDNRRGFLSLGLSDFDFRTYTCVTESVLSLPLRGSSVSVFANEQEIMRFESFPTESRLTTEFSFSENVASHLLSNRANLIDESSLLFFSNCTSHALVGLPDLEIRFGIPAVGFIVMQPNDYIAMSEEDSECFIKFDVFPRDRMNDMSMNFFAIPGINVRVTRDAIQICDTVL